MCFVKTHIKNWQTMNILSKYNRPVFFYFWSMLIPAALWFGMAYLSHLPEQTPAMQIGQTVLGIAGLVSPMLVALYLFRQNAELWNDLKRRLSLRQHFSPFAVGLILLLTYGSIMAAQAVSTLFGYSWAQFHISGQPSFQSAFVSAWFVLIFAPLVEELAWHSYGTDALLRKFSLFSASMIFSVYWAVWHLPLAFVKGYYHSNVVAEGALASVNFVASVFLFVLIMNWLYCKFGRNIWISVLFHLAANTANEIFATHPDTKIIQTLIFLLFVVVLMVKDRELFFAKYSK